MKILNNNNKKIIKTFKNIISKNKLKIFLIINLRIN